MFSEIPEFRSLGRQSFGISRNNNSFHGRLNWKRLLNWSHFERDVRLFQCIFRSLINDSPELKPDSEMKQGFFKYRSFDKFSLTDLFSFSFFFELMVWREWFSIDVQKTIEIVLSTGLGLTDYAPISRALFYGSIWRWLEIIRKQVSEETKH